MRQQADGCQPSPSADWLKERKPLFSDAGFEIRSVNGWSIKPLLLHSLTRSVCSLSYLILIVHKVCSRSALYETCHEETSVIMWRKVNNIWLDTIWIHLTLNELFKHYIILYLNITIQYYTVLYYNMPNYTILYYTIQYHTIPYYTTLYHTIPYYDKLYRTILLHTILHYTIRYYTTLYHTILYNTMINYTIPYYTMHYSVL